MAGLIVWLGVLWYCASQRRSPPLIVFASPLAPIAIGMLHLATGMRLLEIRQWVRALDNSGRFAITVAVCASACVAGMLLFVVWIVFGMLTLPS